METAIGNETVFVMERQNVKADKSGHYFARRGVGRRVRVPSSKLPVLEALQTGNQMLFWSIQAVSEFGPGGLD